MEPQGWRALQNQGSPGGSPTCGGYDVQSTYMPPADTGFVPSANSQTNLFQGLNASNGSPFPEAENPFAMPSSGATVHPDVAHTTLNFHDSSLPTQGVQGKMGQDVPRVQPYGNPAAVMAGAAAQADAPSGGGGGWRTFLGLRFYAKFFNVDTQDVLFRMLDSVIGCFKPNFLEDIGDRGDLYGPFWIATTLISLTSIIGNYGVDKVGYAAAAFYGYVGVIGLGLFLAFKWLFQAQISLSQVWCTYGYSLSIFIPVCILCLIRVEVVRWVLIMVATATSGLFLMMNFRRPLFDNAGAKALPVWLGLGALHVGLGLALKLYFFRFTTIL